MKKEKEKKFNCYGNKEIFNLNCIKDDCKWLLPCKIKCGYKIETFKQKLAKDLLEVVDRKETIELLMKNYDFTYNAAKMAIKRIKNDM